MGSKQQHSGVHLVVDEGPTDPFTLACHNGFWSLSRTEIALIAELKGIQTSGETTLYGTLLTVVVGLLKVSYMVAWQYVGLRLPRSRNDNHYADVLQNMDCAIEVVDKNDVQSYTDEMTASNVQEECIEDFKLEFERHRAEMEDNMGPKKTSGPKG